MSAESSPLVSVIVPARNEEKCLERCLQSLVSQNGIAFEVIVVDDQSTDRTAEIARSFQSESRTLKVIAAPPLSENWTGKNNAMAAGAKIATGQWLLFTDADTFHKPGSLARAVAEAREQSAALLSYSPEQEVHSFLERAVMPVIFAELAAEYPPAKVRDSASPIAAANGQYLMISHKVYDELGGHASIASDLLEDVAMARLVKSSGHRVWFRYGGDAVSTRMYRSWQQMREGWTKNLALLFRHPVWRAVLLLAFWLFSWTMFGLSVKGIAFGYWRAWFGLLPVLFLYGRVSLGRFGALSTIYGTVVGIPISGYLLTRSVLAHNRSVVTWKGRGYSARSRTAG